MAKESRTNPKNEASRGQYFNLDEEKAFFEEVDEEVRNEKFKQLLNKYGVYILGVLILALSVAVGYEKIAAWRINKAEQTNARYMQASTPTKDFEDNLALLEEIVATESGLYKDMAYLKMANILLDNGQNERGIEVLQKIVDDASVSSKIKEITVVKLATYKVDTASFEEMDALLSPVINENGAWAPMAKELLAMSAIQNKDMEKAKAIYQELLLNDAISDDFKARINDVLAVINEAH
jgi:hypothetical protein